MSLCVPVFTLGWPAGVSSFFFFAMAQEGTQAGGKTKRETGEIALLRAGEVPLHKLRIAGASGEPCLFSLPLCVLSLVLCSALSFYLSSLPVLLLPVCPLLPLLLPALRPGH
jgi:hypothetical protein